MNGLISEVLIKIIIDVLMSETSRGTASADIGPEIGVVGDVQMAFVDGAQDVGVAY